VAGTGGTRFGAHGPGAGVDLAVEAAVAAMTDAGIDFGDVDALYSGTAHPFSPRGVFVARALGLTGLPVHMGTNASATGLACIHDAAAAIEAGQADVVLAIGYDAPEMDVSTESVITGEGHAPPVVSFALWAKERMAGSGTTAEHLALVAAKNWNYARERPTAARRADTQITPASVLSSRMVADPLTSRCARRGGRERALSCSYPRKGGNDSLGGQCGLPQPCQAATGSGPVRRSRAPSWDHPN
jgi:acetyl-CoA acetyltransferase